MENPTAISRALLSLATSVDPALGKPCEEATIVSSFLSAFSFVCWSGVFGVFLVLFFTAFGHNIPSTRPLSLWWRQQVISRAGGTTTLLLEARLAAAQEREVETRKEALVAIDARDVAVERIAVLEKRIRHLTDYTNQLEAALVQ